MIRSTSRGLDTAFVYSFAALLLLGPAELRSQWLDYEGRVDGSFTTTCRTAAGNVPQAGQVTFTFDASESIATDWTGLVGAGKVAADGTVRGSVRMLNGPVDWWGERLPRSRATPAIRCNS